MSIVRFINNLKVQFQLNDFFKEKVFKKWESLRIKKKKIRTCKKQRGIKINKITCANENNKKGEENKRKEKKMIQRTNKKIFTC